MGARLSAVDGPHVSDAHFLNVAASVMGANGNASGWVFMLCPHNQTLMLSEGVKYVDSNAGCGNIAVSVWNNPPLSAMVQ